MELKDFSKTKHNVWYNKAMHNKVSRTITGILATLFGIFLVILSILKDFWILIYGIPILVLGIFIFFNKKEDDIEEINGRED